MGRLDGTAWEGGLPFIVWHGSCFLRFRTVVAASQKLQGDPAQAPAPNNRFTQYPMNKTQLTLALTTSLTLVAGTASAVIRNYEIGDSSAVVANSEDPGLVIQSSVVSGLENTAFLLDDGQSQTIGFFNIWTDEGTVNSDDKNPRSIVARLDFSVPDEDAVFTGVTFGGKISWLLILNQEYATVQWDGPVTLDIPGDREFTVSLSDEVFNQGLFALGGVGATVDATITQLSSEAASVPDSGSTLVLMGAGLLTLAGVFAVRSVSTRPVLARVRSQIRR